MISPQKNSINHGEDNGYDTDEDDDDGDDNQMFIFKGIPLFDINILISISHMKGTSRNNFPAESCVRSIDVFGVNLK